MDNYTPNPVIVDRAVELWKRVLATPLYQNERPGEGGSLAPILAAMAPKNNAPDVLESFGVALKKSLLQEDADQGWYGKTYLGVDYGPDRTLADAAEEAGLQMQFPWKTSMHIYTDKVCFSIGYGSPDVYHYPLSGGRWLITDLRGKDIAKLIALIEAGADLSLQIEASTTHRSKTEKAT